MGNYSTHFKKREIPMLKCFLVGLLFGVVGHIGYVMYIILRAANRPYGQGAIGSGALRVFLYGPRTFSVSLLCFAIGWTLVAWRSGS